VLAVQWAYAAQFGADEGAALRAGTASSLIAFGVSSPWRLAVAIVALAACGTLAALAASRAQTRLAAHARALHNAGDTR